MFLLVMRGVERRKDPHTCEVIGSPIACKLFYELNKAISYGFKLFFHELNRAYTHTHSILTFTKIYLIDLGFFFAFKRHCSESLTLVILHWESTKLHGEVYHRLHDKPSIALHPQDRRLISTVHLSNGARSVQIRFLRSALCNCSISSLWLILHPSCALMFSEIMAMSFALSIILLLLIRGSFKAYR